MSEPEQKPTMQDIADAVGVSRMTVSRALRDDPRISESRRGEIRQAAKRLGYRTNPLVSALMAQLRSVDPPEASTTIAIVNCGPVAFTELAVDHPEFHLTKHRYFQGALARCRQLGYQAEEFFLPADRAHTKSPLPRILRARGIRAILFLPFPGEVDLAEWSLESFAMAIIGYSVKYPQLHMALTDQFHNLEMAINRLRKTGRRRIGLCLNRHFKTAVTDQWRGAFVVEQSRMNEADRVPALELPSRSEAEDRELIRHWMEKHRPDAVLYVNHHHAPPLKMARPAAWDCPIISLDRLISATDQPGIDQRQENVAANAVDLIIGQLHRNEYGPPEIHKTVLTSGKWVGEEE